MVGCDSSNAALRSQTQHSSVEASRFTIATRVGSESARKRAASVSLASGSSGSVAGPQQRTGNVFIDRVQYTVSTSIDERRSDARRMLRLLRLRHRLLLNGTWRRGVRPAGAFRR